MYTHLCTDTNSLGTPNFVPKYTHKDKSSRLLWYPLHLLRKDISFHGNVASFSKGNIPSVDSFHSKLKRREAVERYLNNVTAKARHENIS